MGRGQRIHAPRPRHQRTHVARLRRLECLRKSSDEPMARIRAMPHLDIVAEACDRQLRVLLLSLLLFPQLRLLPLLMLLLLLLLVLPLLVTLLLLLPLRRLLLSLLLGAGLIWRIFRSAKRPWWAPGHNSKTVDKVCDG